MNFALLRFLELFMMMNGLCEVQCLFLQHGELFGYNLVELNHTVMNSLTPVKDDYIKSLEKCMKDCQRLIETQKHIPGMERCVELSRLCIGACSDCLVACEAIGEGISKMMQSCLDACKACVEECKNMAKNNENDVTIHSRHVVGN